MRNAVYYTAQGGSNVSLLMNSYSVTIQTCKNYILNRVLSSGFDYCAVQCGFNLRHSLDEMLKCDHSNKKY